MAYLSSNGYELDIFVSYAHVDDQPLPPAEQGWVSTFTSCIKMKLAQKLGRNDAYALWMDNELRGGQPITPHILERVRSSAILLVVLSPGYLASTWCQRELEAFIGLSEGGTRRVFIVELDRIDDADLPPSLADLKRSHFWSANQRTGTPRPLGDPIPDAEYYSAVDDLIREVVTELKQLNHSAATSAPTASSPASGSVFLAEVTDDLDEQRNNVKRYLDQAGITVHPKTNLPLQADAFRDAIKRGLADADLFVQLLSGVAGKRPPDLPEGRGNCQLQLALTLRKPILQWRSPTIDTSSVQDSSHRALLEASTVRAEGIEDFKREIQRRLREQRNVDPPQPAFVFVDMESIDRALAERLCDVLGRHEAGYMLPTEDQDPRNFRKDLREKILQCNALILVYGATSRNWVEGHLKELQKLIALRRSPLLGLALVEGPPDPKDKLSIMLPKMKVINCRGGVEESEIRRFLDAL